MIRSLHLRTVSLGRHVPGILSLRASPSSGATTTVATVQARCASLSAIHRGLRRSDRAQGGSGDRGRPDSRGRDRTDRALEGAASKRQQDRLLRKLRRKQEEDEEGTGKMSRRKRFVDPTTDFGKKSLVYQLKHGELKDLADKIDEPVRPRAPEGNRRKDWAIRDAIAGRDTRPPPSKRQGTSTDRQSRDRRDARRQTTDDRSTRAPRTGAAAPRGTRDRDGGSRAQDDDDANNISRPAPRPRNGNMMPLTIKYTTAASQFLYGRSVVKAALEQARRKLYHLYVYAGESRIETHDIAALSALARRHGVPTTMVPNEDQRLMDKMSAGRPHNGFVLEASPLPQLPVTSLGRVVDPSSPGESGSTAPGFHVELDHQSAEEAAVNGTDGFIRSASAAAAAAANVFAPVRDESGDEWPTRGTRRPLVLLLNEIVDPGNLGAMLRTASYFGVDAVGVTNRNSSALTPVVLKSAAGAVEEISIFSVASPVRFLEESRRAGWRSYAAVAPPGRKLAAMHAGKFVSTGDVARANPLANDPCILVLGNEGFGLPKQVKMAADHELSVPRFVQDSCVDSLNVSVAAGLLCNAFIGESAAAVSVKEVTEGEAGEADKGPDAMF